MLKEKTNRWFLALGAALLCAGLGAAALWDLEIDLALYSPGFLPAVLMEAFGWFPQYLPAVVLCVCIALDGARSMPLRAAGGLLAVAGSGILLYMGAHHLVKRGMSGPSHHTVDRPAGRPFAGYMRTGAVPLPQRGAQKAGIRMPLGHGVSAGRACRHQHYQGCLAAHAL